MQQLAAALVKHSAALGDYKQRLLSAAALELHAAASPLLKGCFLLTDGEAQAMPDLLEGLHAALDHSHHADGVLRGGVAVRLATLLEQQQQFQRALVVVQQVGEH